METLFIYLNLKLFFCCHADQYGAYHSAIGIFLGEFLIIFTGDECEPGFFFMLMHGRGIGWGNERARAQLISEDLTERVDLDLVAIF